MNDSLGPPIRYEGFSLAEKYGWTQAGMGAAATEPAAAAFRALAPTFEETSNDVRKALEGIGVTWQGQAANATGAALRQAAQSASLGGEASRTGGSKIELVGESWTNTRPRIAAPIEVGERNFRDWAIDGFDAATAGIFDIQSDYRKRLYAYQAADTAANEALRAHEQNVRNAVATFPDVGARPAPAPGPSATRPADLQPHLAGGNHVPPPASLAPGGPHPPPSPSGQIFGGSPPTPPQSIPPSTPQTTPGTASPLPTRPVSPTSSGAGWQPYDPEGWFPGWTPLDPRGRPSRPPGAWTGSPGQPYLPRPAPTGPTPGTSPPDGAPPPTTRGPGGVPDNPRLGGLGPGGPGPGSPGPDSPGVGRPGFGGPGSADARPTGPGNGQPQPPIEPAPGPFGPAPAGGTPPGQPRGGGPRPGRTEGDGFDFGDLMGKVAPPVVGALAIGEAGRRIHHHRKHGAGKPLRRSPLSRRIKRASEEAQDAGVDLTSGARPGASGGWTPLHVGPRAFQVGGKGTDRMWIDLTAAPGIGFCGPGAHGALRASWLSVLLRVDEQPPGRIVIPEPDAIKLLGTTRPDPVPEGLYVVADLDHALAALEAEIAQRVASPDAVAELPLVVLILAEPPASSVKAAELAALLRSGHRLAVTALIGGAWAPGASIDIDQGYRVTATCGAAVAHLDRAYMFNLPAAQVLSVCPEIDFANRARAERVAANRGTAPASGPDAVSPEPGAETGLADGAASTAVDPTATPLNAAAADGPGDSEHECGGDSPEATAKDALEHGLRLVPEAGGSRIEMASSAPDSAPASPQPDDAEHPGMGATPTSGHNGAADREQLPPPSTIVTNRHDDARPTTSATPPSTYLVRLEIMHKPRVLLLPQSTSGPAPVDITPTGRTPIQLLVILALNRGGQRRAAAAAALWPETNVARPTNTFNSYRTRLRQYIQKKTNGTITDLIRDNSDGTCELPADLFQVDYWEFLDAIDPRSTADATDRARAYMKALAHYQGDLAETIDADWISEYRDNIQQAALQAAIDFAYALTENHGEHETAIAVLDLAINFDPLHEPIYQHLIRLLMELGRRDAAIQRYNALEKTLARAGMRPLPETTRLLRQ
jgi:DNA-binding SARP family transcriptional activator